MKRFLTMLCMLSLALPLFACQNTPGTDAPSESAESAPSVTAPNPSESSSQTPSETAAPETTAPSAEPSSEAAPSTEAPVPYDEVKITYLNGSGDLSEDRKLALRRYVYALTRGEHIDWLPFISDEVKENWSHQGNTSPSFSVKSLLWEDDYCFAVYGARTVPKADPQGGKTQNVSREHFIEFVKSGDDWITVKDVYTDDYWMDDVWEARADLLRDLIGASWEKDPLTEQDLEEAGQAAIDLNIDVMASYMNDFQKRIYREYLQAVIEPDWEMQWLPSYLDRDESLLHEKVVLVWVQFTGAKAGEAPEEIQNLYAPNCYGWTFVVRNDGTGWKAERRGAVSEPVPPESVWETGLSRLPIALGKTPGAEDPALTEEQTELLLWFADLLIYEPYPTKLERISDEVRSHWGWWYGASPTVYPEHVLWSDDELLVLTARFERPWEGGSREHLIEFVKEDDQWIVQKDIFEGSFYYADFMTEETQALLTDLYDRQRARRPITDEDMEAIRAAVIEREMQTPWARDLPEAEKAAYRDGLTVLYDQAWEKEHVALMLEGAGQMDFMVPRIMVYLSVASDAGVSRPWTASWSETDGWTAMWIANIGEVPAPAGAN